MSKKNVQKSAPALSVAQRHLVEQHMALAENLSVKFAAWGKQRGVDQQELQAQAYLGLCEAALRYEQVPGANFQTYAFEWCTKVIKLRIKGEEYIAEDDVEVAGTNLIDDDEEAELNEKRAKKADKLVKVLDRTERKVVALVYGFSGEEPLGLKEVAKRLRLTPHRVSQIYQRALAKMEECE